MGFLKPNLPVVDHDTWDHESRQERMKPMARHFAEHGFGSPDVIVLFYFLKIAFYALIGWMMVLSTPDIDGFFDFAGWWENPAAFYKFVLWTMLFEVLGLGCGFGPLNLRFVPPMGSFLYWLRPGTIRLPPNKGRIPLTGGDSRTVIDVLLYAGLVISLFVAMWGALPRSQVAMVLGFLVLIGLRDQVIFLAARAEVYGPLALTYLFAVSDQMFAAKLVMVAIWWGAALSKCNSHFPFVVSGMMSNSPFWRFGGMRKKLHRDFPDDLRPSKLASGLAHGGTVVEFAAPAVLLFSNGGWLTTTSAAVMILFHLTIISSFPMGVPLEWNVFMIWGVLTLFLAHPGIDLAALSNPWLIATLVAVILFLVIYGNFAPDKVSFLPSMRYYAGNWATSFWCFKGDALERYDDNVTKASLMPHQQLEQVYGSEQEASIPLFMGYAFRGFYTHGRALWTLVPRACEGDDEDYLVLDGELVAGTSLGWNFGDGHLHDEQLIEALQRRCNFQPGDVRIVFMESQPFHDRTQRYRLIDAATGEFESGYIKVGDMVDCQPTDNNVPVHVTEGADKS